MNERVQALNRAKAWWEGKQDPGDAPYGKYVCDSCSGPIFDKKGTSLVGSWMRCASCTDRLFPVQDTPSVVRDVHSQHVSKPSTFSKQIPQQSCNKCGKDYNKVELTCPHCGKTKWRSIIAGLVFGIVLLSIEILWLIPALYDFLKDGDVVSIFMQGCFTLVMGVLGVAICIDNLLNIKKAVKIRKTIKFVPSFPEK